jgi:hypothetical protein
MMDSQTYEYWLTIVTSRIYTRDRFSKEAGRLGVNRTVPAGILKELCWKDSVLLGDHIGIRRIFQRDNVNTGQKLKKPVTLAPEGSLEVFAYFTVDTIIPEGFSEEAHKEFVDGLDVAGTVEASGSVQRACGSYTLGGGYEVRDSITQAVVKAELVAEKHRLKLKWFMGGRFYPVDPISAGEGKWTIGYRKVQLDKAITPGDTQVNHVRFLEDYERRRHLKKIDAERLDGVQMGFAE